MRHPGNGFCRGHPLRILRLNADSAHARIHRQGDRRDDPQLFRCLINLFRLGHREYGRHDVLLQHQCIRGFRNHTEVQNRLPDPVPPQNAALLYCSHRIHIHQIINAFGHRRRPVSVAVGLHHGAKLHLRRQRLPCLCYIFPNCIQIHHRIGSVVDQIIPKVHFQPFQFNYKCPSIASPISAAVSPASTACSPSRTAARLPASTCRSTDSTAAVYRRSRQTASSSLSSPAARIS